MQLASLAAQGDLLRRRGAGARPGVAQHGLERAQVGPLQDLGDRRADHGAIHLEQSERGAVDRFDPAVAGQRNHARRNAFDNRLDVAAPIVELHVLPLEVHPGPFQLALAGGEFPRHRVERLHEGPELVARFRLDAVIEMAGANLARAGR